MYIEKNTSNTVVLTLSENQSQSTHDWLFEFFNEMTGQTKYCTASDISSFPSRYNEFVIIDSTTELPLSGQLNFTPTGSWTYKIYEMPVASPPSLNPALALKTVEEGSLKVHDPNETTNTNFNAEETKNNGVFDA